MQNLEKILVKFRFLIIGLLLVPAFWALFVPGFYGASDDLHIAWLYEMDQVLKIGQIPPRFVPDLSYGFGYPLFNFVFPLPFYIAETFHLLGLNLVNSIKLLFFLSIPLSFITMYLFIRKFTSPILSLAGAFIYVYTPYRATDLYIRGAIGEIWSFVILPLLALSVVNMSSGLVNLRWIGIGALSLAALILTHNIASYMFFPIISLLWLIIVICQRKNLLKSLFGFLAMIFLGLGGSLYFWLPAILESKLLKYDTVFNFADHFPTLKQLVTPYFGYGSSVAGPYDGMSFFAGLINLLLVLVTLFLLVFFWQRFTKIQKALLTWGIVSFALAVFMMNYRSTFLWQNLPFLPYFQFPWRFLILVTFITPIFIVSLEKTKFSKIIAFFIITAVILLNGFYFRPHDFLGRTDEYYLNRYIPKPVASDGYKKIQEEYLRLPITTRYRPDQNYPRVFPQTDKITNLNEINSLSAEIKTESDREFIISYSKYYYPGWEVLLDGQKIDAFPSSPFGQIGVKIPAGQHTLNFNFEETMFKKIIDTSSIISIGILLLFILKPKVLKRNK